MATWFRRGIEATARLLRPGCGSQSLATLTVSLVTVLAPWAPRAAAQHLARTLAFRATIRVRGLTDAAGPQLHFAGTGNATRLGAITFTGLDVVSDVNMSGGVNCTSVVRRGTIQGKRGALLLFITARFCSTGASVGRFLVYRGAGIYAGAYGAGTYHVAPRVLSPTGLGFPETDTLQGTLTQP